MSKFIYDIAHLRKYVNGDLSAREMHEIERASHDDEMLMDILMGLEVEKEIAESKKLPTKPGGIYRFKSLLIAASIIGILGFVGIMFWSTQDRDPQSEISIAGLIKEKDRNLLDSEVPTDRMLEDAPTSSTSPSTTTPEGLKATEQQHAAGNRGLTAHEKQILAYTPTEKNIDFSQEAVSAMDAVSTLHEPNVIIINTGEQNNKTALMASNTAKQQAAKAASSRVSSNPNMPLSSAQIRARLSNMGLDPKTDFMSVQVIDQHSKQPLAGAEIKDMLSDSTFLTDADGRFSYASNSKRSYMIDATGYNPKEISTQDAELTISLAPKLNKLSSRVTLSQNKDKKSAPVGGWDKYLTSIREELAKVTNNNYALLIHMGLDKKGTPVRIHVLKSSDITLNAKVINLVAQGPLWEGGSDWKNIYLEIKSN